MNLEFHDSTQKIYDFKTSKQDDSSHYITKFKFLSESDDLSGLIGSISHDDLNSLFDLKITKNASTLYTEWLSWPQPPGQPLFVGLIIKNPIFL